MKILLIPLLAATALLGGCHNVSVRHTVEVPVEVTEHRHVHDGVVIVHRHEGDPRPHHHDHYPPVPAPQTVHRSIDHNEVHIYTGDTYRHHEEERRRGPRIERVIVTPAPMPRRDGPFGHALRDSMESVENQHSPTGHDRRYREGEHQPAPHRDRVIVTPVPTPRREEAFGHAVRDSHRDNRRRDHTTLPGNRWEQENNVREGNGEPSWNHRVESRGQITGEHHDNARTHRMAEPAPRLRPVEPQRDHTARPGNRGQEGRPQLPAKSYGHSADARPSRSSQGKPDKASAAKPKHPEKRGKVESETDEGQHDKHWRDR